MDHREKGLSIISKYIKEGKKVKDLEEYIHKNSNIEDEEERIEKYNHLLYFYLNILKNKTAVKKILAEEEIWDNEVFGDIKKAQVEKDDFISNPFVVEEGATKCDKCGSSRTFSYSKQVRSADEGFTTFCTCANCGTKWRIN